MNWLFYYYSGLLIILIDLFNLPLKLVRLLFALPLLEQPSGDELAIDFDSIGPSVIVFKSDDKSFSIVLV